MNNMQKEKTQEKQMQPTIECKQKSPTKLWLFFLL